MANPKAFVAIDIQNDYTEEGAMPLEGMAGAVNRAQEALLHARANSLQIIIVQHIALDPQATFFRPDTEGAQLVDAFVPKPGDLHIVNHYPNAFRDTSLHERLQALQIPELVISGMMTHMCIDATVRAAIDYGLGVTLLSDATATRDLAFNGIVVEAKYVQATILAALSPTYARTMTVKEWMETPGEKEPF